MSTHFQSSTGTQTEPSASETADATAHPRPQSAPLPEHGPLPQGLLYSTSARIGGSGLDSVAHQSLIASSRGGFLGKAVAYDNRQTDTPAGLIRSLRWHPVRLLSSLRREYYYGAKKQYVDWIASRMLAAGGFDMFHGWSGDALLTLEVAKRAGVPSLLEIPTWHRNKGKQKPWQTKSEREPGNWRSKLLVSRQRNLSEYELADVLLVLSEKARETFLSVGTPESQLYKLERGVDVNRFTPGKEPDIFRAVFVGALIERKGVHLLLEAWHRLSLRNAELVLVGAVHEEITPWLKRFAHPSIKVAGFSNNVAEHYRQSSVHVFPSLCEGSAKTTYEAAACGLAQITTRESGDVVQDGVNGLIVPAGDLDALCDAIRTLHDSATKMREMGNAGRKRVVEHYTWDHFRERLLGAYRYANRTKSA